MCDLLLDDPSLRNARPNKYIEALEQFVSDILR
jgi:hypothetical protein